MLSIRLSRRGKKKKPTYRIIVLEKTKDPWGNFLEDLGFYNPHTKELDLKKERIKYWISQGAQASPTVHNLLVTHKVIEGPKVKATKRRKKKEKEVSKEAPLPEAGLPPAKEIKEEVKEAKEPGKAEEVKKEPEVKKPEKKEEKKAEIKETSAQDEIHR